jgi:ATP-dependent DNA ligase
MTAQSPPCGPQWVHEIKHDGYRMMARRDAAGIRLLTRNGYERADRLGTLEEAKAGVPKCWDEWKAWASWKRLSDGTAGGR